MKKTINTVLIATTLITMLSANNVLVNKNVPNPPKVYPKGELGKMVKLGENIVNHTGTNPLTKKFVKNKLRCASCHLNGGKTKNIGTFIGTATSFPAYSSRENTVQTLQDRINNCFMRSMNGKRLVVDSKASIALASYITWLSSGLPIKMNVKKPVNPYYSNAWPKNGVYIPLIKKATHKNYLSGKKIYAKKCAVCHGGNGEGTSSYPPLWGKGNAYNAGAGMSKPNKMAFWVRQNMPYGNAHLTAQQAVDVAIYVSAQDRDSFDLKTRLLPREKRGIYNSAKTSEYDSVKKNFKALGLDLKSIKYGK